MGGNIIMEKQLLLEDAKIIFRNFSGEETKFNPKGKRNFCVVLPSRVMAEDLQNRGWNIKYFKNDDDMPDGFLHVTVSYDNYPPNIVLISSIGQKKLKENEIDILDWIDIEKVDLIIRPYSWSVNNSSGIKAYVKTMYITIYEDELMIKYNRQLTENKRLMLTSDEPEVVEVDDITIL